MIFIGQQKLKYLNSKIKEKEKEKHTKSVISYYSIILKYIQRESILDFYFLSIDLYKNLNDKDSLV